VRLRGAVGALFIAALVVACTTPPSGGGTTTTTTTTTLPGATTTTTTTLPGATTTTLPGVATSSAVVAGQQHTCSLRPNGTVRCWGANDFGQLGNGTTTSSPTPVTVSGLTGVVSLAAGDYFTCAVDNTGHAWCWGLNTDGETGNGGLSTSYDTPQAVYNLIDATQITTGSSHACALRSNSKVVCWGDGFSGELGTGATSSADTPRSVVGITTATSVDAGDSFSCARLSSGSVQCWGDDTSGELGDGTNGIALIPRTVQNLTTATSITTGASFACALKSDTTIVCWGENVYGELGNGVALPPPPQPGDPPPTNLNQNLPVAVIGVTAIASIGAGSQHACAVRTAGWVQCWGRDDNSQLGDGALVSRATPAATLPFPDNQLYTTGGGAHTCTTDTTATIRCFGDNTTGQTGTTNNSPVLLPTIVNGL
jgi:alpha-tubulin suppressor-like RCC1 family protein